MPLININYKALRQYRQTYHPEVETRIDLMIRELKVLKDPFSFRRIYHIPRNVLVRIVEDLTEEVNLPHPRVLEKEHFLLRLPGWKATLRPIYEYFQGMEQKHGQRTVDFMLDCLQIERIDELPAAEQIKLLNLRGKILWKHVGKKLRKELFDRAAQEGEFIHTRMLSLEDLEKIIIPELGTTILGLYYYYVKEYPEHKTNIMDFILDDIGVEKLENILEETQFKMLKTLKCVQWRRIPKSTQLRLLNILKDNAKNKNSMACPHLRAFISENFRDVVLNEIGAVITGLLNYYSQKRSSSYKGTDIDYMLDELQIEKFEKLDFDMQCKCLLYLDRWPWDKPPKKTILLLLDLARKKAGLPHIRFLGQTHFETIIIDKIEKTLVGLYAYHSNLRDKNDKRDIVEIIFDYYKVPEMPFSLKLDWTKLPGRSVFSWRRTNPDIIGHYLYALSEEAGLPSPSDLRSPAFLKAVLGREAGLGGLYGYLRRIAPQSVKGKEFYTWLNETFPSPIEQEIKLRAGIEEKRFKRQFLTKDEIEFLFRLARSGDMKAMSDLIYFYEPMLKRIVYQVSKYFTNTQKDFDDLVQMLRIEFMRLIQRYDERRGGLINYAEKSLKWYVISALKRNTGVIHVPANLLEKELKIYKVTAELKRKLGRSPVDEEIAQQIGMNVEELREFLFMMKIKSDLSLDQPIFDDNEDLTLMDSLGSQTDAFRNDMVTNFIEARADGKFSDEEKSRKICEAIEGSGLTEEQKYVVHERLNGSTFEAIGQHLGFSRERARQVEAKALRKIGKGSYRKILREIYFED